MKIHIIALQNNLRKYVNLVYLQKEIAQRLNNKIFWKSPIIYIMLNRKYFFRKESIY